MFACEQSMEIDQNDYTMNLTTNNTGIPLEYVEFELKHAKVKKRGILTLSLLLFIGIYGKIKIQSSRINQ